MRRDPDRVPPPDLRVPSGLPSLHLRGVLLLRLNVEIIPARGPRGDERLTADDLLKIAYDEARDKGANGVANFTMTVEDAHVTVDELRERPLGGRYADEVYPVSSRSTVTVPVKRYKMSGSLIRITP